MRMPDVAAYSAELVLHVHESACNQSHLQMPFGKMLPYSIL
jgi:hypothetical protein